MELEKLDLSVRTYNMLCRAGINTVEEFQERFHNDADLDKKVGTKALCEITTVLAKLEKSIQQKPTEVAVVVSEEYIRATELHKQIKASMHCIKTAFFEMGKSLKVMRDGKLYKELGYQNFEEYCKAEAEISRRQAYNLITIVEKLPEDFVQSLHKIGTVKLATLAMLPFEQVQEIQQNVDLEFVTVKELKAQITSLTQERDENEHAAELLSVELGEAKQTLEKKDKQFRAAMDSKQGELDTFRADAKRRQDMLITKITKLNEQIAELENRPIEHDVVDNSDELEQLRADLAAARQQLADRPVQETLPTETYTDERKEFNAYLRVADEAVGQVFKCLCRHSKDSQKTLGGIAIRTLEKYNTLFAFKKEE